MIVSADEMRAHLGLDDDTELNLLLERLLLQVEGAFVSAAGRSERPLSAVTQSETTDSYDGTGTPSLFTDYPIEALAAVTIGDDIDNPDEEIDITSLVWRVGSSRLRRRNGLTFGEIDAPAVVHVTYTPGAEDVTDAQLAITRATATLYLQRGAEDAKSESEGGVRSELAAAFADLTWISAVEAYRCPQVG